MIAPADFDPRTRLIVGAALVAAVFVTRRPAVLAAECALIGVILLATAGAGRRTAILRTVGPITLLVLIIGLLSFDPLTAGLLTVRLFNLLAAALLVFQWVQPEELGDALRKMGAPYAFVFILTTAMRYVPLIGRKIHNIRDAQRARGIDLRWKLKNLPNLAALFGPLLIQSFVLADDLALAMEARGFSRKGRSMRRTLRLRSVDVLVMIAALAGLGVLWWLERGH
jgi:energy-coupling factor transport system permease protein